MDCVYKLTVGDEFYIGSTDDFTRRCREYRNRCQCITDKGYNTKIMVAIRENDFNYTIKVIYTLKEGEEKKIKEQEFYDLLKPSLNSIKPLWYDGDEQIYRHEYHLANKEAHNISSKLYHENNKERMNAIKATKINCECGVTHTKGHIARHKKSLRHLKFINNK